MDLIRFIFANTIYLHHLLFIYFKIFAQICIQIFDLMLNKYKLKQIFASEQKFASHHLANICFKIIIFEANIRKTFTKLIQNFHKTFTFKSSVKWKRRGVWVVSIDRLIFVNISADFINFFKGPQPFKNHKNVFERLNNFSCVLTGSCGLRRQKFDTGMTHVWFFLITGYTHR
jgi:hypothetical protein